MIVKKIVLTINLSLIVTTMSSCETKAVSSSTEEQEIAKIRSICKKSDRGNIDKCRNRALYIFNNLYSSNMNMEDFIEEFGEIGFFYKRSGSHFLQCVPNLKNFKTIICPSKFSKSRFDFVIDNNAYEIDAAYVFESTPNLKNDPMLTEKDYVTFNIQFDKNGEILKSYSRIAHNI